MPHPVPIGQYESQVPVEEGLRRVIPFRTGVSTGPAIEDLGHATQQIVQRDAASYAGQQLAQLRVAAEQHLLDNLQKPQADIDKAGGYTPAVMGDFQKSADAALKGAPNSLAAHMIQQGTAHIGADLNIRALHQDAQARIAQRASGAQDAITHAASAVELNPASWQAAGAEQLHTIQGLGLDPETTVKLSHLANHEISEAAARGTAKQDPAGALERLKDDRDPLFSGLDLDSRNRIETYAKGQFVDQRARAIQQVYEQSGTTAGAKALAGIDQDKSIPDDLRDHIRGQVNRDVNEWRDQRREQFAQSIAGLEAKIARGEAGQSDMATAQGLFEKGAFNATQLASAAGGIARSEKKQGDDTVSLQAASEAYSKGIALSPTDKDVRGGVGLLFSSLTRNVQQGSDEYANRAADIARKTGVTPDPAIDWARTTLNGSQDPQLVAKAADLVARVDEANPRSLAFAEDPKTKAMAASINAAVRAGTDPQSAVEMARRNAENKDTETMDGLWKRQTAQGMQSGALTSRLKSDENYKPGFFSSVPAVPNQMQSEFDELTHQYFRYNGGNISQARDAAAADLKHVWGVSEVNGKRELMPYAPEAMFPGLTKEMVREDIAQTAKNDERLEETVDDPKTVRLAPDPERTARTNGAQWNLVAPDQHGLPRTLYGENGRPLVYQLPVTQEDYAAIKDRFNAASMERARAEQHQRQIAGAAFGAGEAAHNAPF